MQSKWINRENNDTLILMFLGWACDEKIITDVKFEGYDTLCFFDYSNDLSDVDIDKFDGYKNIVVVAWSFGVWVADFLCAKGKLPQISRAYALNGTLKPIDNNYGIHEISFKLTLRGLERVGLSKFYERMSSDTPLSQCSRDILEQINELKNLEQFSKQSYTSTMKWNGALVGTRDNIFPPANIENFWNENGVSVFKNEDVEHFPFCKKGLKTINCMLNEPQ